MTKFESWRDILRFTDLFDLHPRRESVTALCRFLLLAAFCLCAGWTHAAGLQFIEVPADKDGPALRGAVWTPCDSPTDKIVLDQLVIEGVKNCPVSGTQLPLIVVSHGQGGSILSHHDTAEMLANAGFVVAAIDHSDDNYQVRGGPNDIVALATRTTDVRRLIDYMTQQWDLHAKLADGQVGFFGFSRGGYTGLVLAGAGPNFERIPPSPTSPCVTAPDGSACAQIRLRFRELLRSPLTQDTRIKAAVIADPLSSVFDSDGLKGVTIPIQLWASEYGGYGVTPADVAAVRQNLPKPPDWHVAIHAPHLGFNAPCSPAQSAARPESCHDVPPFDRVAFHREFNGQVLAFFRGHLK